MPQLHAGKCWGLLNFSFIYCYSNETDTVRIRVDCSHSYGWGNKPDKIKKAGSELVSASLLPRCSGGLAHFHIYQSEDQSVVIVFPAVIQGSLWFRE